MNRLNLIDSLFNSHLLPPTSEIQPLCEFLDAWRAIPGIPHWLLHIIQHGYSPVQTQTTPLQWHGSITDVTSKYLCSEMGGSQFRSSIGRSPHFVMPKRDGGLRPILDLRPINGALHKRAFRMMTLKKILAKNLSQGLVCIHRS